MIPDEAEKVKSNSARQNTVKFCEHIEDYEAVNNSLTSTQYEWFLEKEAGD